MGIKKDKSSSAAAVNSLRAAATYPPGVNVGCFGFYISKCTSCDSHTVYPAICIYQISCVSCAPHTHVLSMYPVYIMCVMCLHIICISRGSHVYGSTYHIHYHFQIAGQYIVFWLMYQIFKKVNLGNWK